MLSVDEVKTKAQGFIIGQVDAGSKHFGSLLERKVESIRTVGETLSDRGETGPGQVAALAADRLEIVAKYFSQTRGEQIVADVEDLARRHPLLTVGAGLTAGLLAARLLQASTGRRYDKLLGDSK